MHLNPAPSHTPNGPEVAYGMFASPEVARDYERYALQRESRQSRVRPSGTSNYQGPLAILPVSAVDAVVQCDSIDDGDNITGRHIRRVHDDCGPDVDGGVSDARGLTDTETERIADYVAIHNAFEGFSIDALRHLKADVLRYSKQIQRGNKRLYDLLRMPDLFVAMESAINKRLVYELSFATNFVSNLPLQQRVRQLHDISTGTLNDAREGTLTQIKNAVLSNLYEVIGSPSVKLPHEPAKLKCTL